MTLDLLGVQSGPEDGLTGDKDGLRLTGVYKKFMVFRTLRDSQALYRFEFWRVALIWTNHGKVIDEEKIPKNKHSCFSLHVLKILRM